LVIDTVWGPRERVPVMPAARTLWQRPTVGRHPHRGQHGRL